MKRVLIDSHLFLWAIMDDPKLSRHAAKIITTTPQVFVSTLSLFELKLKEARGKIKLPRDLVELTIQQGFQIIDLSPDQLTNYRIFNASNPDTFDNALLSVAESQKLHFLTIDSGILALQASTPWIINGS